MFIQSGLMDKQINIGMLKDLQTFQHFKIYHAQGTVPVVTLGGMLSTIINISSAGDFLCRGFTGSFTTLQDLGLGAGVQDDGVDHLRMKIRDVGLGVDLFDDYIPLHCILSPGRRRAAGVLTSIPAANPADSSQLYLVMGFQHVFPANANIQIDLKNDSAAANSFELELIGMIIRSPETNKGLRKK